MQGSVYQINVKAETAGEYGLPKKRVESAKLSIRGLEGDFNRYRHEKKNDTPEWALLLLPLSTINQLNKEGWPVKVGDMGENITISGITHEALKVGTVVMIGETKVQIS